MVENPIKSICLLDSLYHSPAPEEEIVIGPTVNSGFGPYYIYPGIIDIGDPKIIQRMGLLVSGNQFEGYVSPRNLVDYISQWAIRADNLSSDGHQGLASHFYTESRQLLASYYQKVGIKVPDVPPSFGRVKKDSQDYKHFYYCYDERDRMTDEPGYARKWLWEQRHQLLVAKGELYSYVEEVDYKLQQIFGNNRQTELGGILERILICTNFEYVNFDKSQSRIGRASGFAHPIDENNSGAVAMLTAVPNIKGLAENQPELTIYYNLDSAKRIVRHEATHIYPALRRGEGRKGKKGFHTYACPEKPGDRFLTYEMVDGLPELAFTEGVAVLVDEFISSGCDLSQTLTRMYRELNESRSNHLFSNRFQYVPPYLEAGILTGEMIRESSWSDFVESYARSDLIGWVERLRFMTGDGRVDRFISQMKSLVPSLIDPYM